MFFKVLFALYQGGLYITYLSSRQHDQLQIIVTGFGVPYRSYITSAIIKKYPNEIDFAVAIGNKTSCSANTLNYQTINSELGKIKSNSAAVYKLLINAKTAKENKIVSDEINILNISTLIALTVIFKETFSALLLSCNDQETYLM